MTETEGKNILIVEDERPLATAISAKLGIAGFKTTSAASVAEAQVAINSDQHFDAIWLDHYLLGDEDGLQFLSWCRNEDKYCKDTPIFVVTNTAGPEKQQTYMKLGATKYFIKSDNRLDEIIDNIKESL